MLTKQRPPGLGRVHPRKGAQAVGVRRAPAQQQRSDALPFVRRVHRDAADEDAPRPLGHDPAHEVEHVLTGHGLELLDPLGAGGLLALDLVLLGRLFVGGGGSQPRRRVHVHAPKTPRAGPDDGAVPVVDGLDEHGARRLDPRPRARRHARGEGAGALAHDLHLRVRVPVKGDGRDVADPRHVGEGGPGYGIRWFGVGHVFILFSCYFFFSCRFQCTS